MFGCWRCDYSEMAHQTRREKSTWTPMNYSPGNQKIFFERFALIKKWHASWSNKQKWALVEYVLQHLTDGQLLMVCSQLQPKMLPPEVDFTRVLPRNICLKIMSYLDPQSLCRAAQVSWHWRYVSEHNNVWKTKCLMQGWFLPSPPNQYDISVWKRHYVACIRQLYWKLPQTQPSDANGSTEVMEDFDQSARATESTEKKRARKRHVLVQSVQKPWKDPDSHPEDTHFQHQSVHHHSNDRLRLSDVDLPVQTPLPKSPSRQDSEVEQSGTQQHLMHFHPVLMEKMRLESPDTKQLHTLTHENHPFALLPEVCSRDVLHAESAVSVMSSPRNSTDPNTAQSADLHTSKQRTKLTSKPWNVYPT